MGRSESIDLSHKELENVLDHYSLENVQKREQQYTNRCEECENLFNTKISVAKHCGTCSTVANLLYVHYALLMQRWNVIVANPNKIVERVFNHQVKPVRSLTQNG